MNKIWFFVVILILLFAIYGTWGLALHDYKVKDVCPKILGIPACYIVLVCFSGALLSHLISFDKANLAYFGFVGLVTLIAITGTMGELTGMMKCPRTSGGIPMCCISFGICTSILLAKFLEMKALQ